jgi:hypothetical protein
MVAWPNRSRRYCFLSYRRICSRYLSCRRIGHGRGIRRQGQRKAPPFAPAPPHGAELAAPDPHHCHHPIYALSDRKEITQSILQDQGRTRRLSHNLVIYSSKQAEIQKLTHKQHWLSWIDQTHQPQVRMYTRVKSISNAYLVDTRTNTDTSRFTNSLSHMDWYKSK